MFSIDETGAFPTDQSLETAPDIATARRRANTPNPEIPGYHVGKLLGRGGMGVIYRPSISSWTARWRRR